MPEKVEEDGDNFFFVGTLGDGDGDSLTLDRGRNHPPFPFPRDWCDLVERATPEQAAFFDAPYYLVRPLLSLPSDEDTSKHIFTGIRIPQDGQS